MTLDNALIDKPLKVSEINKIIKETFRQSFYNLTIEGEVSGFKPSATGHWYFTLKDKESQISAVMFRFSRTPSSYIPQNGDMVTVYGNIDVYEPRGTYQIICQRIVRQGDGEILIELEKRKQYYQSLGYFDIENKKSIPKYPTRIGIVTASNGAAIEDMLNTLKKRAPSLDVVIYPCLVQGESAAEDISNQINNANLIPMCDVLIVGRGGGSKEDLLCFSDPLVIEAIHNSEIPVISAVGHEVDYSLSDYVADVRAITPTEGAVIATEGIYADRVKLKTIYNELSQLIKNKLLKSQNSLSALSDVKAIMLTKVNSYHVPSPDGVNSMLNHRINSSLIKVSWLYDLISSNINDKIKDYSHTLEGDELKPLIEKKIINSEYIINNLSKDLTYLIREKVKDKEQALAATSKELSALSPKEVLKRGYSIVYSKDGKIIKTSADVKVNDQITIDLYDGKLNAIIGE